MYVEKVNKLQVIFLALLLYGYEVVSFIPNLLNLAESRPISIAYRAVVLLFAIFIISKFRIRLKKEHFLIFIFWFLYLCRLFYQTAISSEIMYSPIGDYWSFSALIIITSVASATKFSEITIDSARKWVWWMLLIVCVWGLYNNITNPQLVPDDVLIRVDANSSLNTVSFGRASGVLFFICFTMFLEKGKPFFKIILILAMLLSLFNLFMAGSRGPLLQLLIVLIVFLFSIRKTINRKYIYILILCALGAFIFFPEYFNVSELIFERVRDTGFSSNESDRIRAGLFNSAWEQFQNSPFIGDSIETNFMHTYPHNLILESLMATGIVGGILSLIILIISFSNSVRFIQLKNFNWLGAILLMDVIASFSSGSIVNYLLLWPLLSLTITNNYKK